MKDILLFIIIFFYSNISNAVEFRGKFEQGSFIIGKATKGSKIEIDKRKIRLTKDGYFAFGLGRERTIQHKHKVWGHLAGRPRVIKTLWSALQGAQKLYVYVAFWQQPWSPDCGTSMTRGRSA